MKHFFENSQIFVLRRRTLTISLRKCSLSQSKKPIRLITTRKTSAKDKKKRTTTSFGKHQIYVFSFTWILDKWFKNENEKNVWLFNLFYCNFVHYAKL